MKKILNTFLGFALGALLIVPATGQGTFPGRGASGSGSGDIEGVTAGNGLTGGGTSGSVTLNVGEGLAIDVSADAVAFDPTELIGSRTWGDGSTDTVVWTFNRATGTDPTLTFGSASVTVNGDVLVADEAYDDAGWNGDLSVATKNAIRDKIETIAGGAFDSTTVVGSQTWGDGSTDTIVWTFDRATGTDPTVTVNDDGFSFGAITGTIIDGANNTLSVGLTTSVTGVLPEANGGTNQSTYSTGNLIYASAANTLSKLAIGTEGQALLVSAGGIPEWATLPGGGDALTSGTLGQFAATTSAQFAGVISNETGTGVVVLATGPTLGVPVFDGYRTSFAAKTGNFTFSASEAFVTCDATGSSVTITGTLPTAASISGRVYTLKRIDTDTDGSCVIAGNGAETIDGAASVAIGIGDALTVVSDNTNWVASAALGTTLSDPDADRVVFWDDSAGAFTFLTVGSGLDLTGTTLTATGAGSGDVVGPASSTDNAIARFDSTTGKLLQDATTTLGDTGIFGFIDNIRQTFNPGANASGLNVGSVAGDPDTPINGDIWYDSTANELTARINGANVALGAGGGGAVATDTIWDAAGDLAVGSGSDTAVRLARGTALQYLRVNAGGTDLEWGTLAAGGLGSELSSTTNDILGSGGDIVLGGTGLTNNEALTFDFETTVDKVLVTSATGVLEIDFSNISLRVQNGAAGTGLCFEDTGADHVMCFDTTINQSADRSIQFNVASNFVFNQNVGTGDTVIFSAVRLTTATGVKLTAASGVMTMLGESGAAENLIWDLASSNAVNVSSSTGVTVVDFGTLNLDAGAYSVGGAAGGTGTSCSAFTGGLCTTASLEPLPTFADINSLLAERDAQIASLEARLATLEAMLGVR